MASTDAPSPSLFIEETETLSTDGEQNEATMSTAEEHGLANVEVPMEADKIHNFQFDDTLPKTAAYVVIGKITQKLVSRKIELPQEKHQVVFNIIKALNSLETLTTADEKRLEARYILETVRGDNHRARGPYRFPVFLCSDATIVLAKINALLEEEKKASEAIAAQQNDSDDSPRPRKKQRTTAQTTEQQPTLTLEDPRLRGLMRGLVQNPTNHQAYTLEGAHRRNCKRVGHNGIAVGQWWPKRLCALRDGAHGASQAGIAGSENEGAYSIVVASGKYLDLDKDLGQTIYYSASGAHDNTDSKKLEKSSGTRALERSKLERRSIRVLRGAGGDPVWSPRVGIRYDGLYKIVERKMRKNHKGGLYMRFKLEREEGQAEIDKSRPTAFEKEQFELLKQV